MSKSKNKNAKKIPVLKRKPVRRSEPTELKADQNNFSDSPEFRAALTETIRESLDKAIPSIVEEVIKDLKNSK